MYRIAGSADSKLRQKVLVLVLIFTKKFYLHHCSWW